MKKLKKDLHVVTQEFRTLTKKMGQLTSKLTRTAIDELEHAQAAMKLKSPAQHAANAVRVLTRQTDKLIKAVDKFEKRKAATQRKAKAGKAPARKKGRPGKKTTGPTATDQVISIIKRSKKGVDLATLVKKTGFEDKKVRNIVFRAYKQGKINRTGKGIYVGTK
jgi:septal ring factor EnvC (AmiA/AmiB activator)